MKVSTVLTLLAAVLHVKGGTYSVDFLVTLPKGTCDLEGALVGATTVTKVIVEGQIGEFKTATLLANSESVSYVIPFTNIISPLCVDHASYRKAGWNIRYLTATYNDGNTIIPLNCVAFISNLTEVGKIQIATVDADKRFPKFPLFQPKMQSDLSSYARYVLVSWEKVTKKAEE